MLFMAVRTHVYALPAILHQPTYQHPMPNQPTNQEACDDRLGCFCKGRGDGMFQHPNNGTAGVICSADEPHPFDCPAD